MKQNAETKADSKDRPSDQTKQEPHTQTEASYKSDEEKFTQMLES
jgi:hypothetical protein